MWCHNTAFRLLLNVSAAWWYKDHHCPTFPRVDWGDQQAVCLALHVKVWSNWSGCVKLGELKLCWPWAYLEPNVSVPWAQSECPLSRAWVYFELSVTVTWEKREGTLSPAWLYFETRVSLPWGERALWSKCECPLSRARVYLEPSERILSQAWVYLVLSVSVLWAERECTLTWPWVSRFSIWFMATLHYTRLIVPPWKWQQLHSRNFDVYDLLKHLFLYVYVISRFWTK